MRTIGSKLKQPSRTLLQEYYPALLRREEKEVRRLLGDAPITIIFDGMTRQGELFVIVIRFVTDRLEMVQKLVALKTLEKSLTAVQMAAEITHELRTQLMLDRQHLKRLVCAVHDRAAVNMLAIKILVGAYNCLACTCLTLIYRVFSLKFFLLMFYPAANTSHIRAEGDGAGCGGLL